MAYPTINGQTRSRNAARTKQRILDAAEHLFAEHGFEQTSLADVGERAGVSRATPGYFFGSKDELYQAVLAECFAQVRTAVQQGRARTEASNAPPEAILAGAVGDYYDFLASHPTFVRLIEREALTAGPLPEAIPPRLAAGQDALAAIIDDLGIADHNPDRAAHFLVSLVALCWFPIVHSNTLLQAVGLDPEAKGFDARRRNHVIDLVLHGVRGSLPVDTKSVMPTRAASLGDDT